ncbi:MAG: UDP-N-acetylglucosamine--N-acetylmuramyl-(pentapeptide) pyrophosphoryl-undecaprenol N-acetylglucosamine transferase, partial [Actinobacteria bacterium]|nr:UDP-N-acetylglucosamine--N-acetylmuramyl-(pentapeptide) pyrophosphoryl-undecaprenol N-acetylglucosamine transferase [Actinomycetota bacterium]
RLTGRVAVAGFVERMEDVYAAADLVVSRAGAATIAELAASGAPSILVPYPYARRDHQTANARALVKAGGAVVVSNADATPERLGRMIDSLLADGGRLAAMAEGAKSFGKPNAARTLAEWVLELGDSHGR